MSNFETALTSFIAKINEVRNDYYIANFSKEFAEQQEPTVLSASGRKYSKLLNQGSVVAFIDKATGDIYKPASWKAPAKGVRGNIHNEDGGKSTISCTGGIVYRYR